MELSEMAIGIANLPNQIHRRSVIKGFDFNLLVVGDSGLGKSTFLNMLFQSDLYTEVPYYDSYRKSTLPTPQFNSSLITLVENAVKLNMELIELGDLNWCMENQEKWDEVIAYITDRLQKYLNNEDSSSPHENHQNKRDSRIHCCLYFIPPTGHRLRAVDVNFLRAVSKWVNVIPLIAKADTLTPEEMQTFKRRIREDIATNDIRLYTFPDLSGSDVYQGSVTAGESASTQPHFSSMPFAVSGSLSCVTGENGSNTYVRNYPWGTVKIDDPKHSDFEIFNNLFLKTHMFHLIFSTKHHIYEKYRRGKLLEKLGFLGEDTSEKEDDLLSCSDLSLLAHEVMDMEVSMKKENEHLKQLEHELNAEYQKKVEEFTSLTDKNFEEYQSKYKIRERELEDETANMSQLSRVNSKSSKGEKRKTLSKMKLKSK